MENEILLGYWAEQLGRAAAANVISTDVTNVAPELNTVRGIRAAARILSNFVGRMPV